MGLYYDSPPAPDYRKAAIESAEAAKEIIPLEYETELKYRPLYDQLAQDAEKRSIDSYMKYLFGGEEVPTINATDIFKNVGGAEDLWKAAKAAEGVQTVYQLRAGKEAPRQGDKSGIRWEDAVWLSGLTGGLPVVGPNSFDRKSTDKVQMAKSYSAADAERIKQSLGAKFDELYEPVQVKNGPKTGKVTGYRLKPGETAPTLGGKTKHGGGGFLSFAADPAGLWNKDKPGEGLGTQYSVREWEDLVKKYGADKLQQYEAVYEDAAPMTADGWIEQYIKDNPESDIAKYVASLPKTKRAGAIEQLYQSDAEWLPKMAELEAQSQLAIQQKFGDAFVDESMRQARKVDPDWFKTREALSKMILSDLDAGNQLTDDERRLTEQSVRKAQAARGNLYGGAPTADEVLADFMAGDTKRQRAIGNASAFIAGQQPSSQMAGVQTAQGGAAPYAPVTPGTVAQGARSLQGFAGNGPVWDRGAVNAGSQAVYGQQSTYFNQSKQAKNSFWSGMLSNVMGMAGGAASMGMMCWVAREVYGADDPKWLEAREWMLEDAPADLRKAYQLYGEAYAEHIHRRPALKARWRSFFDRAIAEHRSLNAPETDHEAASITA